MRTIVKNVYTINEHPNKEKCFEWIRNNWHDLNQYAVDEVILSLVKLQEVIGGELDYSISAVPDRGEYIKFTDYDEEELNKLDSSECPLTGIWSDCSVIEGLQIGNIEKVLQSLHDDTEYFYSDEGLLDFCEANEYEFYEDGKVF